MLQLAPTSSSQHQFGLERPAADNLASSRLFAGTRHDSDLGGGASTEIDRFVGIVFEAQDVVEVRAIDTSLPKDKQAIQRWFEARELSALPGLGRWNDGGRNIYVGLAARLGHGQSGNKAFRLCRVLVADFDGMSVADAMARLAATDLPPPTLVIDSGHGAHAYWKLTAPITDAKVWGHLQRCLAKLLNSDKSMADADQLIRLPGYLNAKAQPYVPCKIVSVDNSLVYTLQEMRAVIPLIPEAELVKAAPAVEGDITLGTRNTTLMSLGGSMRKRGMSVASIEAALLAENQSRCVPPLDVEEVKGIARSAGRYAPSAADSSHTSLLSHRAWPQAMGADAYHGLAGEIIRKIEPHSEADPTALLIHFLVMFGSVVGRSAYFEADGAKHYTNLFAVTVGETAKGRKGTAQRQIERIFGSVAPEWLEKHVVEGLSSGEGLIWAVRDRIMQRQPIKEKGRVVDYEEVEVDPGINDKRLLVGESEFAGTLKVAQRETNTLSPVVRRAWDQGSLRTLTKNAPATATDAHISIIGHITREELRRCLDTTETANGFCNRFLWLCVKRSKCLAEGGAISTVDFGSEVRRLGEVIEAAKSATLITRNPEARELWGSIYPTLSAGRPGLLGAVLSRAEAQVMRLAMVYALLDQSRVVRVPHLNAALAVWNYTDQSAAYIFGSSLGDRDADQLLSALRGAPDGLSRTQITNEVYGRHRSAEAIQRALAALQAAGAARPELRTDTGGRAEERWFAVVEGAKEANKANKGVSEPGDSSLYSLSSQPDIVPEDDYDRLEREGIQLDGVAGGGV